MVNDVAGDLPPATDDRPLRIVDFGSGKAYLTFALYHYFRIVQNRSVHIVGLDLKTDVVAFCNTVARDLLFDGLTFSVGDIAGFEETNATDLVVPFMPVTRPPTRHSPKRSAGTQRSS
jgi:SAM-dependent methyltransferase